MAALVWTLVDIGDGRTYTREYFRYWNSGMFFVSFAAVGYLVNRLREALDAARQSAEEKDSALRELEESTLRLRQLEGSFQTMCAWTNQIKDGDEWVSFQEFLYRRLQIRTTHGISPEGMKVLKERESRPPMAPPSR